MVEKTNDDFEWFEIYEEAPDSGCTVDDTDSSDWNTDISIGMKIRYKLSLLFTKLIYLIYKIKCKLRRK